MTILPECAAELERCFRAGISASWAADKTRVAYGTAQHYYADFAARGIPRGPYKRKPPIVCRRWWPKPYAGPEWIGKPIAGTQPVVMIGAAWIGRPVVSHPPASARDL